MTNPSERAMSIATKAVLGESSYANLVANLDPETAGHDSIVTRVARVIDAETFENDARLNDLAKLASFRPKIYISGIFLGTAVMGSTVLFIEDFVMGGLIFLSIMLILSFGFMLDDIYIYKELFRQPCPDHGGRNIS